MSLRSPFTSPFGKREEADAAKQKFAAGQSDHLTIYKGYLGWKALVPKGYKSEIEFCRASYLSRTGLLQMEDLKREFLSLLYNIGFVDDEAVDSSSPSMNRYEVASG